MVADSLLTSVGVATGTERRLLLPPKDAARVLSISERTLWTLTQRGDIPCVRIGRAKRYSPSDLVAWIDRQKTGRGIPE